MLQGTSARFDKQDLLLESMASVVGQPPKPLGKTAEEKAGWGMAAAVVNDQERRKFAAWLYGGFGVLVALSLGILAFIKVLEFVTTHQVK